MQKCWKSMVSLYQSKYTKPINPVFAKRYLDDSKSSEINKWEDFHIKLKISTYIFCSRNKKSYSPYDNAW